MNQISGLNRTPAQLAELSACFCLDHKAARSAELYLLCQLNQGGFNGPGSSPLRVTFTGNPLYPIPVLVSSPVGMANMRISGDNPVSVVPGVWIDGNFTYSEAGASAGSVTSLTFDNLVGLSVGNFAPATMAALASLSLPVMGYVGGNFNPSTMAALTSLSIPSLSFVGGNFSPGTMASLTFLNAPDLEYVGGNFTPSSMGSVVSLSIPKLKYVAGNFNPNTIGSLTTLVAPSLQFIGGSLNPVGFTNCTTLSFPAMVRYGGSITLNGPFGANLTSLILGTPGTLKAISTATISASGEKLDAASVNGILALLVSLDGTNGTDLWGAGKTLTINGGTNAAPSGQGILDKATLIARTATVTTN